MAGFEAVHGWQEVELGAGFSAPLALKGACEESGFKGDGALLLGVGKREAGDEVFLKRALGAQEGEAILAQRLEGDGFGGGEEVKTGVEAVSAGVGGRCGLAAGGDGSARAGAVAASGFALALGDRSVQKRGTVPPSR